MYHSIFFGDKNTWDDWHLVPTSRPVFAPPKKKTNILDIPGFNGVLDLSESLTGYPVYSNREGSFEFLVMNDYHDWKELYSEIMEHIHGKRMNITLEDDPEYFYEGELSVDNWKSTVPRSTIIIKYSVGPYKWSKAKSTDEWLWDPFNFITGIASTGIFKNIEVDSDDWELREINSDFVGSVPICPEFIVSDADGIDIKYINEKLGINREERLQNGVNFIPELVLYGEPIYNIYFKGHGTVSIDFRKGRL